MKTRWHHDQQSKDRYKSTNCQCIEAQNESYALTNVRVTAVNKKTLSYCLSMHVECQPDSETQPGLQPWLILQI